MVASSGRRLGRYHLVEPIGAGPCGEVFRAKVVGVAGMERQFAIKRFYPWLIARPEVGPRLQQAIRGYGGLDHPRIARMGEFGVASGETFTATELVPGLDVGRLTSMTGGANDRLPAGTALGFVSAAARAIGYAHGRGVCHLGIAPGNLIATVDGDAKVTDFGIFACRLGGRIAEDDSLIARIAYLAPEQLLGEAPAAAADVFSLGVLAYELVSGARPFGGATGAEVAHAIVSARPAPLELPRPIARVIDRCLARSPFERFPDARSLADALDAAMRLSPLVGDRRDLADRVRGAVEHLARINEQQLSGALNFGAPSASDRGQRSNASAALPLPPPTSLSSTLVRPPPMPGPPPTTPRPSRATVPPPLVAPPTEPGGLVPGARIGGSQLDELSVGDETAPRIEPLWPPTEPVQLLTGPRARLGSSAPPMTPIPPTRPGGAPALPPPITPPQSPRHAPEPTYPPSSVGAPSPRRWWIVGLAAVGVAGAAVGGYLIAQRSTAAHDAVSAIDVDAARLDAGAAGPTDPIVAPDAATTVAAVTVDAGAQIDAGAVSDAGAVIDAGAEPIDGGATPPGPRPPTDSLEIGSSPASALVFLDGADQGKTPVTLPGSADQHSLAVFAPGYQLYLASVDGAGRHDAVLRPIAAFAGPGGIKVRCKSKRRYYVFIDGAATGQLCPTERIAVTMGEHQIEIYDLVTETRRTGAVRVVQTSRSTRIKFD